MLVYLRHDEPPPHSPHSNTLGSREWLFATCIHLLIIMNDHNSPVPRLNFCLLPKKPVRAWSTTNSHSGLAQHKKLSSSSWKCFYPLISDGFAFRFKRCHEHFGTATEAGALCARIRPEALCGVNIINVKLKPQSDSGSVRKEHQTFMVLFASNDDDRIGTSTAFFEKRHFRHKISSSFRVTPDPLKWHIWFPFSPSPFACQITPLLIRK